MKFIGGLALTLIAVAPALALPQDAASSTVAQAATSVSVSLTPQQTCINACPAGDVTCQAACVGTAHPNESQVNQTTECAAKCDQGDGTPAATEKYSQCVQACISSFFPTSQTVPAAVGTAVSSAASNAASATGAASGTHKASGSAASATGSATGTATGSAASASSSGNAASSNIVAPFAGLAGLLAVLAL